jgi:dTDP-4-amino-4,6-dideoxygalactose transaminase
MLLTDDGRAAEHVRHLATQAREPAPYYEHRELGYNYRLSNLLAALGRSQLADLPRRVARRRAINARYREALADLPVTFMPEAPYGTATCWLTCLTVDRSASGLTPDDVRLALEERDIEARRTWKPMHLQPVFAEAEARVDGTAQRLFESGLCLPSGSSLSDEQQDEVIAAFRSCFDSSPAGSIAGAARSANAGGS